MAHSNSNWLLTFLSIEELGFREGIASLLFRASISSADIEDYVDYINSACKLIKQLTITLFKNKNFFYTYDIPSECNN